ncbi:hypothetical protein SS1G_14020 [Sclerotinia sclerotiorum 1980 UF-70]|uniref:UBC core domain-containing protein n=1 Tax=Sclerotinia sclerotiorum (strain ATCC 18683 / 1980 / Ss-1) TaxID=665079 RepID=A7F8T9_SCLS1|nr:hypothetical protein SS1G_14020 [Sclerotinia sclerotiorum 1980 UF-70]EDN99160.1 hypothetical protein SS1G_14020 [Sclerotinia sclerotiorum 1980 UF-70]
MTETLRRRLLLDIAELQAKPYPNIFLHVDDENLNRACLVLTVEEYGPLHMRLDFPSDYPIQPPIIKIDSNISHPNIIRGQICASILNTPEGWTPAYTLKGFAIQLLSFFASDAIEQVNGKGRVYLRDYRARSKAADGRMGFCCTGGFGNIPPFKLIFHFMNDVMVKFNKDTLVNTNNSSDINTKTIQSTLTHASEKAIESYFHLFHLLICLAIDDPSVVGYANDLIDKFVNGGTSKSSCPNLNHILIASLISDVEVSYKTMETMIKEAITRNVVWMLGEQPGLSYIEPSEVSQYRLEKTFEASKTSYRILMFLKIFKTTAIGKPKKPLSQLANEAFKRHGAPPRGSARYLADWTKRIHLIASFPDFFRVMGMGRVYK